MFEITRLPGQIVECDECHGHGEIYEVTCEHTRLVTCPACNGRGKVQQYVEVILTGGDK